MCPNGEVNETSKDISQIRSQIESFSSQIYASVLSNMGS